MVIIVMLVVGDCGGLMYDNIVVMMITIISGARPTHHTEWHGHWQVECCLGSDSSAHRVSSLCRGNIGQVLGPTNIGQQARRVCAVLPHRRRRPHDRGAFYFLHQPITATHNDSSSREAHWVRCSLRSIAVLTQTVVSFSFSDHRCSRPYRHR